jgi:hypothetical protein
MIVEEQISARQKRARKAIQRILTEPAGQAYGDYTVKSVSGRDYRVAMRGPSLFENFCSCADFAVALAYTSKPSREGVGVRIPPCAPDPFLRDQGPE